MLTAIVVCAFGVLSLTISTDPYRLRANAGEQSSARAIDLFYHLRLHKPHAVERLKPRQLVAGSSRSARLAPPGSDLLSHQGYNASLPGASLTEIRRIIEHAHTVSKQKRVMIGLDYYMFAPPTKNSTNLLVDARFLKPDMQAWDRLRHYFQHFEDAWISSFSVDAVLDSIRAHTFVRDSAQLYREDGTWEIATGSLTSTWLYSAVAIQVYQDMSEPDQNLDYTEFNALLAFLDKEDIETHIVITPFNGLILQIIEAAGAWQNYLDWQRQLVELASQHHPTVSIYGIENKPALVLENVDAENPSFRDGAHLTRDASSQIYECLLNECDSEIAPEELTIKNVDHYLFEINQLRLQYHKENRKRSNRLIHRLTRSMKSDS